MNTKRSGDALSAKVLSFIKEYNKEKGRTPSPSTICRKLGVKSHELGVALCFLMSKEEIYKNNNGGIVLIDRGRRLHKIIDRAFSKCG